MSAKDIGARLQEERLRLGLSQQQMADAGRWHRQTQLNYERGYRTPKLGRLRRLDELGVNVEYVATGKRYGATEPQSPESLKPPAPVMSPEVQQLHREHSEGSLLENYRSLDAVGRRRVELVAMLLAADVATRDLVLGALGADRPFITAAVAGGGA